MKNNFKAFEGPRMSAFVKVNMNDFEINKSSNHHQYGGGNSISSRIYDC